MKEKSNFHKAVLLTSLKDVNLLNKDSNIVGIASAYPIIQENNSLDMDYFLDYQDPKINLHDLVGRLVSGWYRDNKGIDIIRIKDVSIGALLTYRISIEFSSALRYYFAFKEYVPKYEKILVSYNIPSSLNFAANFFSSSIDFFYSENKFDGHTTSSPNRGAILKPPIHKYLSKILRLLQSPLKWHIKNKVLIINDWTYRKLNNNSCLNINTFNPLRSFCLRYGHKFTDETEKKFPSCIDNEVIYSHLLRVIKEFNIDNEVKNDLIDLFIEVLNKEYVDSRENLINTYCSCKEMFEFYKPSMIVVPGYHGSFYQTVYGIAKSKNIPSIHIQDGHALLLDKYLLPKDIYNKKQMIDYFSVMGSYVDNLYKNNVEEKKINTIKISSPILKTHKSKECIKKSNSKYVIIMFPYGMIHSPYCRWDKKYKYVIDAIITIKSLHYKNIKVKMKTGYAAFKEEENELMKTLLHKYKHSDVEMVYGEFSDYLNNAECVVGYIGTAIVESIFRDVPFYVYEPKSLGMTDSFIKKSVIIDKNKISRDLVHLKKSISNNNSVSLDKDKLFDGVDINEIDFTEIAKRFNSPAFDMAL